MNKSHSPTRAACETTDNAANSTLLVSSIVPIPIMPIPYGFIIPGIMPGIIPWPSGDPGSSKLPSSGLAGSVPGIGWLTSAPFSINRRALARSRLAKVLRRSETSPFSSSALGSNASGTLARSSGRISALASSNAVGDSGKGIPIPGMPMPIIPFGFIMPGIPPIIPGMPMPGGVAGVPGLSGSSSASMGSTPASSSTLTISAFCSLTANSSTVRSSPSPPIPIMPAIPVAGFSSTGSGVRTLALALGSRPCSMSHCTSCGLPLCTAWCSAFCCERISVSGALKSIVFAPPDIPGIIPAMFGWLSGGWVEPPSGRVIFQSFSANVLSWPRSPACIAARMAS